MSVYYGPDVVVAFAHRKNSEYGRKGLCFPGPYSQPGVGTD